MSSKSTFTNSTSKSYAIALYELSKENSELDKVEDEMKKLSKLLDSSADFKEMILNPTVAKNDKKNNLFLIATKPKNFLRISEKLFWSAIENITFLLSSFVTVGLKIISLKSELVSNNFFKLFIPISTLSISVFSLESS